MAITNRPEHPPGSTPVAAPVQSAGPNQSNPGSSKVNVARTGGRRVKRFQLIDELGQGATGRVYRAEDTVLKRHVALKLLPAKHRDGRPNHRTERLVREARSAATLEHPAVVVIHEIDQVADVHYIAMELVEGGNLERLVQMSGPMEVERACQLCAEAAEAIAHAHSRGIIHRDVKPANLLLTRSGRCKVADFGLACFDEPGDAQQRQQVVGTPHYIPPEIAVGEGATEASDIYSLGCTLWFLLTGRPPFTGTSTRDVLNQHATQPLPDLRKWRPDLPERLVQAIERACAKHPRDRYDSAEQFGKVLRTFTIPTGGGGGGSHGTMAPVGLGASAQGASLGDRSAGAGSMSQSQHLQPVTPAPYDPQPQQAAGAGAGAGGKVPKGAIWAGAGAAAAVVLIGIGVWMARPSEPAQSAAGGNAPAGSVAASVTPVEQPAPAAPAVENLPAPDAPVGVNVLVNGDVEADPAGEKASGWYVADRCKPFVRVVEEDGNRFLRLTANDPTTTVHAAQRVDVDPSWKSVTVSVRMRAENLKIGKKASDDARVAFAFRDAADKAVGTWPPVPYVREDTTWVRRDVTVPVPAGAKQIYLQCLVAYATGTVDFDDVSVVPQR